MYGREIELGRRASGSIIAIASACLVLQGCVPDGPQPPRSPEPITIDKPPELPVERIGFAVDNAPLDTDGNGYFDTWMVTAFLFPPPERHPLAIFAEGDVGFALRDPEGNLLARWRFTPNDLNDNRLKQFVGETYRTPVSMLDPTTRIDERLSEGERTTEPVGGDIPAALRGTDRLRPGHATLFMTYFPPVEDEPPVRADRGVSVRVGPTGV